uniref:KIND domain-containing protein n=1 Tax=Anas platyrhynchos platyrhynchos TaxID=8840 RepID=A0A493TNB3_ANAPP
TAGAGAACGGMRTAAPSARRPPRAAKVSLAEVLRCFEHPISEGQAWALCFQCCSGCLLQILCLWFPTPCAPLDCIVPTHS